MMDFDTLIATAPPELQQVCRTVRSSIHQLDPDVVEIVYEKQRIISFGWGPKKMSQHYAYLQIHRQHINLGFYQGASLPDPDGLLDGTGAALRHMKLRSLEQAEHEGVRRLLQCVIAERRGYARNAPASC